MRLETMAWPPHFKHAEGKAYVATVSAAVIAALSRPRLRNVVQAGGCTGLWPLALAKHFEHVYTFEPAPENFRCLQANVASIPNITAFDCALGDTRKLAGLSRPKLGAGLWQVDGPGETQVVRLDDFLGGDTVVDAIVLDVEGSEVAALDGAEKTIVADRPVLWFEFLSNTPAIEAWLEAHGYEPPMSGFDRDKYSVFRGA